MLLLAEPPVWVQVLCAGLATWRLSHMLVHESGPYGIIRWTRARFGVQHDHDEAPSAYIGQAAQVFSCLWCISVWVGGLMLVLPWQVSALLAFSTVAAIIHEWMYR